MRNVWTHVRVRQVVGIVDVGSNAGSVAGENRRWRQRRAPCGELHRNQQCAVVCALRACALKLAHETLYLKKTLLDAASYALCGSVEALAATPLPVACPPGCAEGGLCSVCSTERELTTVEIACLKISCSWLLFSKSTEYLSKERILPVSFTPLTRYIVIGVLSLRTVLRNVSWMFCAGLLSMCRSPIPSSG